MGELGLGGMSWGEAGSVGARWAGYDGEVKSRGDGECERSVRGKMGQWSERARGQFILKQFILKQPPTFLSPKQWRTP